MGFDDAVKRARQDLNRESAERHAAATRGATAAEDGRELVESLVLDAVRYLRQNNIQPTHIEFLGVEGLLKSPKVGSLMWRLEQPWAITEDGRIGRFLPVNEVARVGTWGNHDGARKNFEKRQRRNEGIARKYGVGDLGRLGRGLPPATPGPPKSWWVEDPELLVLHEGALYYNSETETLEERLARWVANLVTDAR